MRKQKYIDFIYMLMVTQLVQTRARIWNAGSKTQVLGHYAKLLNHISNMAI